MIVDASALVAILRSEPEGDAFAAAILDAERPRISAATLLEAVMVAVGRGDPQGCSDVMDLCEALGIEVVSFTAKQAELATAAFLAYGKGRAPAALNFGDCIAYALSRDAGSPLLYKGEDFAKTDIESAL